MPQRLHPHHPPEFCCEHALVSAGIAAVRSGNCAACVITAYNGDAADLERGVQPGLLRADCLPGEDFRRPSFVLMDLMPSAWALQAMQAVCLPCNHTTVSAV